MARSIARRTLLPQAILVGLLLVPLAVASDSDSKYQDTHTDARDFVAGGMVHLRLRVGDLQIRRGPGYGESSGWLGKTLKYQGDGKFELRAHVSVGDITLEEK